MDIYTVNEDLIKTLVKLKRIEICSLKFNELSENYAKVNYVENLLLEHQQIPKLELKVETKRNKSDTKSLQYRKEGNEYFSLKKKNYFEAMHMYNKSICFAENNSENISIGYANRSAILFEWARYKECLENIRLAKEANYPERLMHKLEKREKECLNLIESQPQQDDKPYEFKLSYDPHPKVPFIANCLDMKNTEELGRYIYTKRTLKPGDLVSIEEPFCTILLPHMKYIRCANCTQENYLTLIPCPNCTCTMFCSRECMEEGYQKFHKYECPIIDFLLDLFNKIHLTALRVCLQAITLFPSPKECMIFCEDSKNQNHCSFTLDYCNFDKKEHYKAIHGLVTNEEKRNTGDLFQRAVIIAVLKRYLLAYTPLSELLSGDEKYVQFFINLLFRHAQTSPSNMHSISLIEQKNEGRDDQTFATAAYAFGSLLNHSCAPNTVRIYRGTTMYLFVLRPIPEGEALYENYGYHHATQPKNVRQNKLNTQYHFICKCEACENNYPSYHELPAPLEVPEIIEPDDYRSLQDFNKQFALDKYKGYCEFLDKYNKYYPIAQISAAEESLKMALNILADSIPLKAKY